MLPQQEINPQPNFTMTIHAFKNENQLNVVNNFAIELHTCIKKTYIYIILEMEITLAQIKEKSTTLNHSCRK